MSGENWAGKRIADYARYSGENQRETSLDDQLRRAREYARRFDGVIDDSLVFLDPALSGATVHRPEFQNLMKAVEEGRVDIILTEDVSRLSRDMADAAHFYKRIAFREVVLIGIADGLDTRQQGAKILFSMRAMAAELYLDDLKYKTRRGLEGCALAKRSTGGRVLGYRTRAETDSAGKVIGATIVIHPEEADVVRMMFAMSAAGHSCLTIAKKLNLDEVPVLRPSRKNRKKGWVTSTVRAILHNPLYVGRRTYGKREWRRDPDTGKRRSRERTDGVISLDQPELQIVDNDTWTVVQDRLSAVAAKYSPKAPSDPPARPTGKPGRETKYPFSGLLYCACCDTPMVIRGGSPNRVYGCGDAAKRGICENRLLVQERHVRTSILAALQEHITSPWAVHYVRKQWAATIGDSVRQADKDLDRARAHLKRSEARLKGFAEMWAEGMRDDDVRTAWDDAKLEARGLRSTIASLEASSAAPIHLPSPGEVEDRILSLHRLVDRAPVEAREVLGAVFGSGKIVMTPQPDKSYLAKTEILPLVLIARHNTPRSGPGHKPGDDKAGDDKASNPRSDEPGGGFVYFVGCAGRI